MRTSASKKIGKLFRNCSSFIPYSIPVKSKWHALWTIPQHWCGSGLSSLETSPTIIYTSSRYVCTLRGRRPTWIWPTRWCWIYGVWNPSTPSTFTPQSARGGLGRMGTLLRSMKEPLEGETRPLLQLIFFHLIFNLVMKCAQTATSGLATLIAILGLRCSRRRMISIFTIRER